MAVGCEAWGRDVAITITPGTNGQVRVHADGDLFTVYHSQSAARPFFYPVLGPSGQYLTRRWPLESAEGEEHDHEHHRGLWYTHGDMNGHDFWSEGAGPKVAQTTISVLDGGVLVTENDWLTADGETICTDRRRHRFSAGDGYRQIDVSVTLFASAGRLVIGDTKEGSMAIRLPATLRVEGDVAAGRLFTSEGKQGGDAWGTRASWCASVGPVDGRTVGIIIMDHPSNPRHPSWWHARTYGLLAANAVGQHYFEGKPEGAGDLAVESGNRVTFVYRILFHETDTSQAQINRQYRAFCAEPTEDTEP